MYSLLHTTFVSSMALQIFKTGDNSHTLYNTELDETYHSRNGALEESRYVFIEKGLHFVASLTTQPIHVLEVGFGTGLNAILTLEYAVKHGISVNYHAIETTPLTNEIIESLDYTKFFNEHTAALFTQMHQAPWNEPIQMTSEFNLNKHHQRIQEFIPSKSFNLIYFDAFAPDKQPEMWQPDILQSMYDCLNDRGTWITYSSKGELKRNLRAIGFTVERLPGPPRKRHMLRATK
jgi:tRNA U34 5-methylaminomethyl-2-thiouridine-forming methyltransferase MnmC